jgi:GNAT superfamily N-acetyltransferase
MEIRLAQVADAPAISCLIRELSASFLLHADGSGAEPFYAAISEASIRRYIESQNFSYYIAHLSSSLVGVVAVRDHRHLYHLFIAREFQGQGFARELWEFAKANAMASGQQAAFTVNSSLNAVPVYQQFGFAIHGAVVEAHGVAFQPMQLGDLLRR